jgi:hypothetical protein
MRETKNKQRILVEKSLEKWTLGRSRGKWKDNMKTYCEDWRWKGLTQNVSNGGFWY